MNDSFKNVINSFPEYTKTWTMLKKLAPQKRPRVPPAKEIKNYQFKAVFLNQWSSENFFNWPPILSFYFYTADTLCFHIEQNQNKSY